MRTSDMALTLSCFAFSFDPPAFSVRHFVGVREISRRYTKLWSSRQLSLAARLYRAMYCLALTMAKERGVQSSVTIEARRKETPWRQAYGILCATGTSSF